MGLHQDIKAACTEADSTIASAAKGTEAGIYHLPYAVAGLVEVLVRYDDLGEILKRRGISIKVQKPEPHKYA